MMSDSNPIVYLNEVAIKKNLPLPQYNELEKTGPDHCPVFIYSVTFSGFTGIGEGSTKKEAKRAAAYQIRRRLLELNKNDEIAIFVFNGIILNMSQSSTPMTITTDTETIEVIHQTYGHLKWNNLQGQYVIINDRSSLKASSIYDQRLNDKIRESIARFQEMANLFLIDYSHLPSDNFDSANAANSTSN